MTLTPDQLSEIQARADAATPGPWKHVASSVTSVACHNGCDVVSWQGFDDSSRPRSEHNSNSDFIAHARTDVPSLLATVRELQTERDEFRGMLVEFGDLIVQRDLLIRELTGPVRDTDGPDRVLEERIAWLRQ